MNKKTTPISKRISQREQNSIIVTQTLNAECIGLQFNTLKALELKMKECSNPRFHSFLRRSTSAREPTWSGPCQCW